MKRSIYLELVFIMMTIIIFTVAIPFIVFQNCMNKTVDDYQQGEIIKHAKNSIDILKEYNLPPEALINLVDFNFISAEIKKDISSLNLSEKNWRQLEENNIAILRDDRAKQITAVINYKEHFIVTQLDIPPLNKNVRRLGYLFIGNSMLLGFFMVLIVGRYSTRVYRNLKIATKKIAAGDFTQRLPTRTHPDELASMIDSFNEMAMQLQSIEMLRSGFISDVSHQFKTPLTAIEGFAKLLEHTEDPKVRKECIDVITSESRRLSQLTDNILMLNRLDNGTFSLQIGPVHIDEQIRLALALNESKWCAKNIVTNVQLDEFIYNGNDGLLSQVWLNLIDNAIKFSPQNGTISVSVKRHANGHGSVTVNNSGDPIPPEKLSHIFEKFFRAECSGTTEGNGLGLSIVQRVIQLHHGSVKVASDIETGTTFTVIL